MGRFVEVGCRVGVGMWVDWDRAGKSWQCVVRCGVVHV